MYSLDTSTEIDSIFEKLKKKNPKQLKIIDKKVNEILQNPYHFKPLKGNMKNMRRVHIDSSFVLIYEIDEENKTVILLDFNHHDNIY